MSQNITMSNDHAKECLAELEQCLEQLRLPPLNDRSATTRKVQHDVGTRITVAILSRAPPQLATLMEGGRLHRESVFLVLDSSWVEKREGKNGGKAQLFLRKGVWMEADTNQSFLDTYDPPREITYFANIITEISSFGERADGVELAKDIAVPKSLDTQFEPLLNDKLWVRALLLRGLQSFPDTVAFSRSGDKSRYVVPDGPHKRLRIVYVPELGADSTARVDKAVRHFLEAPRRSRTVVVKLGGPTRRRGVHMWYLVSAEREAVAAKVNEVLASVPEGDSVLLEEYITTMPSRTVTTERGMTVAPQAAPGGPSAEDIMSAQGAVVADDHDEPWQMELDRAHDHPLAFFCRVVVALNGRGEPRASTVTCGVVPAAFPSARELESLPCSLPQVMKQWGVYDEDEVEKTRRMLFREAERTHELLVHDNTVKKDGAPDVIAVDIVLGIKNSVVIPFIVRLHDHDSLSFSQKLDHILGDPGRSVRAWVQRMLFRSQDYLMRGKTVLVVGGGGFGKLEQWDIMKQLGLRMVLADHNENHVVKDEVFKFLHIPSLTDHSKDTENAALVVQALEEAGIKDEVDGVTTTYDPCVVVCAAVAELLGLHGNGAAAHDRAKDKYKLARFLKDECKGTHDTVAAALFVAESVEVANADDVRAALSGSTAKMTLPAVLKNTHGMCGMGVKLVRTVEEAVKEFNDMRAELEGDLHSDWTGLSFAGKVFLMEYLDGTEHDVDICMFNGELVTALVTDNGPTRLPYFNETCACMPSRRHPDEVKSLIAGAYQCARAGGLHSGVYNVEMKYTSKGPRLIEINARLGGFYLTNWAQRVFDVNLIRCVCQVACGIRPVVPSVIPPSRTTCVGLQLYNSHHGAALKRYVPADEQVISREERFKQNRFRQLDADGTLVWISMARELGDQPAQWEGAYANIGCSAPTHEEAAAKLLSVVSCFGIDEQSALKTDYFVAGLGIPVNRADAFAFPLHS
eukprot:TRINITY_DN8628_c0_g1_i1.p2 TRINITY_DN8628_c0_g1~~TRINITY_DN8628_c0_g1_i1.p2  ORF type:complete len:986 (-),score=445.26 TRINITY_DN8628_c0_g1_i1:190-3108(-)